MELTKKTGKETPGKKKVEEKNPTIEIAPMLSKNYIFDYFRTQSDLVTVFPLDINQLEFRLVHNQKENNGVNHISFNLNGIRNISL